MKFWMLYSALCPPAVLHAFAGQSKSPIRGLPGSLLIAILDR